MDDIAYTKDNNVNQQHRKEWTVPAPLAVAPGTSAHVAAEAHGLLMSTQNGPWTQLMSAPGTVRASQLFEK
eukprot:6081826-Prymnesium_polylepis.1